MDANSFRFETLALGKSGGYLNHQTSESSQFLAEASLL
jgi:hypothetical protein